MNILFYTYGRVDSTKGGTERTTVSVATALTRYYNCRCFSLYEAQADTSKEDCFVAEYCWDAKRDRKENILWLRQVIKNEKIDFLIDQGAFIYVKPFKEAAIDLGCKVILAHHFEPGSEIILHFTFRKQLDRWRRAVSIRDRCAWLKNTVLFLFMRISYVKSLRKLYFYAYQYADRVVLLSNGFINQYQIFGRFCGESNFSVIPNGLSFSEFISKNELKKKKKLALIVARLDDNTKRLSLALQIWKKVKENTVAKDWKLNIVGEGPSLRSCQRIIQEEYIPDVCFCGRQDPIEYYKEASIFLMTSRTEGWGLTLTEAQQFGVVPIAFNTYASLNDIITDEDDGLIVPEGNINEYVERLLGLIQNAEKRHRIAIQGIHDCKRFSQCKIAEKWWNLLNELKNRI